MASLDQTQTTRVSSSRKLQLSAWGQACFPPIGHAWIMVMPLTGELVLWRNNYWNGHLVSRQCLLGSQRFGFPLDSLASWTPMKVPRPRAERGCWCWAWLPLLEQGKRWVLGHMGSLIGVVMWPIINQIIGFFASPWHPQREVQTFSQQYVLCCLPGDDEFDLFGVIPHQEYCPEMQIFVHSGLQRGFQFQTFYSPLLPGGAAGMNPREDGGLSGLLAWWIIQLSLSGKKSE